MTTKVYAEKMIKRAFSYEFKSSVVQATITQESNTYTSYDPTTGVTTNLSVPIVKRAMLRKYKSKYIDHNRVQQSDRKLTLIQSEWDPYVPQEGDKVNIGTSDYNVVSVTEDGLSVSWTLQLRGV